MEQRYRAVLEAEAGCPVTEVAARHGVSRQSVHAWVRRYRAGGLAALADRRTGRSPARIRSPRRSRRRCVSCAGRIRGGDRPGWRSSSAGATSPRCRRRPRFYRVLVRNALIAPGQHRRPASSYIRWERGEPMELWQLDIMGGVFLADGTEVKLVSGLDDHSRYCVIAQLVTRATGRAVCAAFAAVPGPVRVPAEVLSDNGKQFTGRFTKPRPVEVLFERICRENGITTRLTRPRTPTTTGKIERWHKTLREEFLATCDSFASLAHAQAELDAWVDHYNCERPHQSLGMATPASRFTAKAPPQPGSRTCRCGCHPRWPPCPQARPRPRRPARDRGQQRPGRRGRPGRARQREHVRRRAADLARQATGRAEGHPPPRPLQPARLPRRRADQDPPSHPGRQRPRPAARHRRQARPALTQPPPCHPGRCPPTPSSKSSAWSARAAASASAASRSAPGSTSPGSASPCAWTPSSSTSSPPTACWPAPCPARCRPPPAAACTEPASPGHRPHPRPPCGSPAWSPAKAASWSPE